MSEPTTIDVYPVGVLDTLRRARAYVRGGRYQLARIALKTECRRVWGWARAGNWRAVKNTFNGYLAEISYPPSELVQRTCGHGWTKRRAVRRMGEYLWRDNAGAQR